jgi:phosphoglycerate kinase
MEREVKTLHNLLDNPARPFVVVLGGAKVRDKLGVIKNLRSRADAILLGGAMANTFLLATGRELGCSLTEPDLVSTAEAILRRDVKPQAEVVLPSDVTAALKLEEADAAVTVPVDELPADYAVYDIGPETAGEYARRAASARTVFWNGPMGVFETEPFDRGTITVAEGLAECSGTTVVGGGDSTAALKKSGLREYITHLSTGGGASLAFLEGEELPGVQALRE